MRWFGLVLWACGEAQTPPPADAGVPTTPPSVIEALAPERYDCRSTAVVPPQRPPLGCFADPSCRAPLLASHRMAVPFAPENSLSALRAAILLGVDIAETDLRRTADGALVLVHDGTVDRTFEGTGEVESFTLEALRALKMRAPAHGDFGCEQVPTLEDALAVSAGKIVLELEVKDSEAGVLAAQRIQELGRQADTFFLCGMGECERLRAAVPEVRIMTRPRDPDQLDWALSFAPGPIMVHIDPTSDWLEPQILERIRTSGAKIFGNGFVLGDAGALGGDVSGYRRLFDLGLDVVQVQNPHWALFAMGRPW